MIGLTGGMSVYLDIASNGKSQGQPMNHVDIVDMIRRRAAELAQPSLFNNDLNTKKGGDKQVNTTFQPEMGF